MTHSSKTNLTIEERRVQEQVDIAGNDVVASHVETGPLALVIETVDEHALGLVQIVCLPDGQQGDGGVNDREEGGRRRAV